jgi:hypothetical protein
MSSLQTHELGLALLLDNGALRSSVASREEVHLDEILSLASGIQALFLTTVLASRELGLIKERRELWIGTTSLFDELAGVWDGSGSDDPRLQWLIGKLRDFRTLVHDETQIYEIRPSERRRHALTREAAARTYGVHGEHGERNESTPDGYRDQSTPQHIYSLGRL